jgi:outer membrane protein assembly factor BamD
MMVGRFYVNNRHYLAAINRFKNVVNTYSTTSHVPEALFRLTECFTALGLKEEAQKSAAVLGYNFPQDQWYRDAFSLVGGDAKVILQDQAAAAPAQP